MTRKLLKWNCNNENSKEEKVETLKRTWVWQWLRENVLKAFNCKEKINEYANKLSE